MSNQTKFAYTPPTEERGIGDGAEVIYALGTRFDVLRTLSEDGTHSVYLARNLGRPAAAGLVRLVVLSPLLSNNYRQVELFRLEAAAAARLSHKNIVKAETAEEANGVHFYTTQENSDAKTLREYLKLNGWLGASEAATIGLQIADALEYAHSQGVLHLTLDPEKVLLLQDGTALVSGFGIDRDKNLLWARHERSHRCAAPYISPEQILSADVDQRCDLYHLGIILYEMLTDRVPFESADSSALRLKHLNRSPQPPYAFRPELSRELSRIILALLGKRPDERPFSTSDFKAILWQCVETGSIADEECEEISWPAVPGDSGPTAVLTADAPSDRVTVIAEEEAPTGGAAAAATLPLGSPVDAPALVAETEGPILIGQEFQDPAYLTQAEDKNNFEDAPELVSEIVSINGRPYIDTDESPFQYPSSHPPRDYVADGQLFSPVTSDKATPSRLMWLAAVILFGGVGLLWATGVLPFQGAPAGAVISGEVAEPRPDDGGEATTETLIPVPEPVAADPIKEIPSRPAALSPAADSDSVGSKIPIAAAQTDESVDARSTAPLPPKSSYTAPPDLSHISVDPVLQSATSAELQGDGRGDLQAQEPSPSIERPASEERPAPTIIRKSGDVLQNTATRRPPPVYPTAARSDNIRGPVTVEVMIDEEGSVIAAKPISGPEQLRTAAVKAARGWKWTPTRVGRKRAQVVGTITFHFKD